MGNYITQDLLEERVGSTRLDNLCKVTGADKTALLENVIERAEAVIDGYAAVRFKIPLPANYLTEEWALCIAEYELYKRGSGAEVPAKIKDSYEDVLKLLKDMAAGGLNIPSASAPELASESGSSVSIGSASPMMDESSLNGF